MLEVAIESLPETVLQLSLLLRTESSTLLTVSLSLSIGASAILIVDAEDAANRGAERRIGTVKWPSW